MCNFRLDMLDLSDVDKKDLRTFSIVVSIVHTYHESRDKIFRRQPKARVGRSVPIVALLDFYGPFFTRLWEKR